jgi:hypothetical protein
MHFGAERIRVRLGLGALLLLASCGGAPTATKLPPELYRLRVQSADGAIGALLLSIEGGSGAPVLLAAAPVTGSIAGAASPARVLLVGPLAGIDLIEVRAVTPGVPPTVTVLEASAGAGGAYAPIAVGGVTVSWTGVER